MVEPVRIPGTPTAPLQLERPEGVTPVVVGIDVVDLGNPRTAGKASDDRFLARVLADDEMDALASVPDPDLDLWCRWAAKEAAFKVVSKVRGTPPSFVHRAFAAVWHDEIVASATRDARAAPVRSGHVRYANFYVPVIVRRSGDALHSVAFSLAEETGRVRTRVERLEAPGEAWSLPRAELERSLSERELDAVHSRASAAVRVAARGDLARALDVAEERLEIVCMPGRTGMRPPHVLLDGQPTSRADVSLSHDGPWIAWVTWVDAATPSPEGDLPSSAGPGSNEV